MRMKDRLIVALDVEDLVCAEELVDLLKDYCGLFKIGARLFTGWGHDAIRLVHKRGAKVFLDLKYHDIPTTVALAGEEAAKLGIAMFTVHTMGGREMMESVSRQVVKTSLQYGLQRPLIFGVTILTSLDQAILRDELGIKPPLKAQVKALARLAKASGLDGVVVSTGDIQGIREVCGGDFRIITPGIRLKGADKDDQKRTATPGLAIKRGADYIVVGRPITQAKDPVEAAIKVLQEMEEAGGWM
jgi:orotidine-5'-phosphate decarboxylase